MKQFLFLLCMIICLPAISAEYSCCIKEKNAQYYYMIYSGETANSFCNRRHNPGTSDFNRCVKVDYPKVLNAYKMGNCEKLMPPKVYNIDGCYCESKQLKNGQIMESGCDNRYSNPKCDIEKSMKKFDAMLYKF